MKNLVYLAFLALVGFGIAGYFLNWYKFTDDKSVTGKRNLSINIDTNKVSEDLKKGEAKAAEALQNLNQEAQAAGAGNAKTGAGDQKPSGPPQLQTPQ